MTKEEQNRLMRDFIASKDMLEELKIFIDSKQGGRFTEEPQHLQNYWYVDTNGSLLQGCWTEDITDYWKLKNLPLWKSLEDCTRYLEINDFIHERARPFEPDLCNYFIIYDYGTDTVGSHESYLTANQLYFDKDDIDEILYKFTAEELKKYYFLIEV